MTSEVDDATRLLKRGDTWRTALVIATILGSYFDIRYRVQTLERRLESDAWTITDMRAWAAQLERSNLTIDELRKNGVTVPDVRHTRDDR